MLLTKRLHHIQGLRKGDHLHTASTSPQTGRRRTRAKLNKLFNDQGFD